MRHYLSLPRTACHQAWTRKPDLGPFAIIFQKAPFQVEDSALTLNDLTEILIEFHRADFQHLQVSIQNRASKVLAAYGAREGYIRRGSKMNLLLTVKHLLGHRCNISKE
jgi:hypothetical protein